MTAEGLYLRGIDGPSLIPTPGVEALPEAKSIRSECPECEGERNHDVLFEISRNSKGDYQDGYVYRMLSCKGCETVSYRQEYHDYEAYYQTGDDEYEHPIDVDVFPRKASGTIRVFTAWFLPEIVRSIYQQTILAVRDDARILAGLGLRGTVEAICNDIGVTGGNLGARITRLATQGIISRKDAERLHGIRFLGNDAAHEIKQPSKSQIDVALKIVEHAINTVYILEKEAKGELDTVVSDFDEFIKMLRHELKGEERSAGEEFPLSQLLGKSYRRVQDHVKELEADLISEIGSGKFVDIELGTVREVGKPPKSLQLFRIK